MTTKQKLWIWAGIAFVAVVVIMRIALGGGPTLSTYDDADELHERAVDLGYVCERERGPQNLQPTMTNCQYMVLNGRSERDECTEELQYLHGAYRVIGDRKVALVGEDWYLISDSSDVAKYAEPLGGVVKSIGSGADEPECGA